MTTPPPPLVRCSRGTRRRQLAAVSVLGVLVLGGCAREVRVVRYKPWFAGLEGAQLGTEAVIPPELRPDPTGGLSEDQIRVEGDDKSVTLLAKTGRQLMIHVYTTLANEERELFTTQVLSEMTKSEFQSQGIDPHLAYDAIKAREDDVIDFFNAIPYAENTPGVFWQPQGNKVFRLEASGLSRTGLKIVAMDMAMEHGNWKLRWFVPAPGERAIDPLTPQSPGVPTRGNSQGAPMPNAPPAKMPDVPINQ